MSNRFTYTINEDNSVDIFDSECLNENGAPNIHQPVNVDKGDEPFESRQEAEEFAIKFIERLSNPEKHYISSTLTPPSIEETPAE